jgi:tRNA (mo5U34)-methyltransferase
MNPSMGGTTMNARQKKALINEVPFWYHSIDLGDGIFTPGFLSHRILTNELEDLKVPGLEGKTVLDIGAWDGFFSFEAEKLGAARILALDHYVWHLDFNKTDEFGSRILTGNTLQKLPRFVPRLYNPGTLPGKIGFDTAHRILNSEVEQYVGDFMKMEFIEIGSFDIVLFLGVLYHLRNPFEALRRLSLVTQELAIIESAGIFLQNSEEVALYEFYETTELNNDISNWWAPNLLGLIKTCRAAGFRHVRPVKIITPEPNAPITRGRIIVHAEK